MKNMASQTQPVKTYSVQGQIGDLFLLFDSNGDRWTSIRSISISTCISLARLDSKADARYWQCAHFPGIGYCIPVPKLQEFLNSIPKSWVPVTRESEFSWMLTHAARALAGFTPKTEQTVTPLLPEVVEAQKSNLPIHSMPMPEVKAAPVAELLPIRILPLGEDQVNAISARDLHAFLEVKSEFKDWIRNRIQQYNFIDHQDYEVEHIAAKNLAPICSDKLEYLLTLDMAKELAMVERNEKGKQARQYFLECERRAKAVQNPFLSQIPKTLPDALRLCADLEEKRAVLSCKVEEQQATISTLAPKADGLDRLTITTQGTVTLTEAAKLLQQPPRKFTAWLQQIAWVYRSGKHLLPYQDRIHAGHMEHKVVVISEEISVPQAVITPKGLVNLSARLGKVAA